MDFSCALSGVEVTGREGQNHAVDRQELNAWAFLLFVKPQLEVL